MLAGDTRVYPYKLKDKMPANFVRIVRFVNLTRQIRQQNIRPYAEMDPEHIA